MAPLPQQSQQQGQKQETTRVTAVPSTMSSGPRSRHASLVSTKNRQKLASECDVCAEDSTFSSNDATALYPALLQTGTCFELALFMNNSRFSVFDNVKSGEWRITAWLNSWRVFRWTRRFFTPVVLPYDLFIFTIKRSALFQMSLTLNYVFLEYSATCLTPQQQMHWFKSSTLV